MTKRLALSKSSDDNRDKGGHEEDADAMQGEFIAGAPQVDGDALEEFGNGPLAHPDEQGVEDAGGQDEFRTEFAVPDLLGGVLDADGSDIVGAVYQDDMYKSHAREKRD